MEVSKLTLKDAETLAEFKRIKAPLGVINPIHSSGRKPQKDPTPDLTITATTMKPVEKQQGRPQIPEHLIRGELPASSPKRPPEGQLAPKNFMPGFKRPQSAKERRETKELSEQIFSFLPLMVKKQALHKKLSILTKKDVRTSTEEYLGKVRRNLNAKGVKKRLKEDVRQEGGQVMAELDTAFTKLAVTEPHYKSAREELESLVDAVESQLWKEKTLSRFMNRAQVGEVTLQKLRRLLHTQQVDREGNLIAMQKFVHGLRQWKSERSDPGPSGLTFVIGDLETYMEETMHKLMPEDRAGVSLFFERLNKYTRKTAVGKQTEVIPMVMLEKVVSDLFNKWDGERIIIEGVIHDIENAISQEEKLKAELKLGVGGKDLELRVIAEFINQYFDKLEESVQKKKDGIQRILVRLKSGQEKPEAWAGIIRSMKQQVENEDLEKEWKQLNKEAELAKAQEKKAKSPKTRTKTTPDKTRAPTRSNVGPGTKPFVEEYKAKETEAQRYKPTTVETRNSASFKNPLDSLTSLPRLEEDVEDAISILNPSKKEPSPEGKRVGINSSPQPPAAAPAKAALTSFLSKVSQPTTEDTKLAELRALKEMSPFQSLDFLVSKKRINEPALVESHITELELKRGTRGGKKVEEHGTETEPSRSELIQTGAREFSPYMDERGDRFDPGEMFRKDRESLKNHIDPRFVEEMLRRSPDPQSSWYIRPHHLKSVTYHPYSIEDNPDAVKYQHTFDTTEDPGKPQDVRDSAVGYLEKTVEDLKCELEERKRRQMVDAVPANGSYLGWVGRTVEAMNTYPLRRSSRPETKEKLVVSTYESILDELRHREEELLNARRRTAYESHRPPQGNWYSLKSHEFSQELHRNLMTLKVTFTQPNDGNKKLLNTLAVSDLY